MTDEAAASSSGHEPKRGSVGSPDRAQRLTIGLMLLVLNLFSIFRDGEMDVMRWIALGIQMELILTGLFGWCPLYWSFSTHSCPVPGRHGPAARDRSAHGKTTKDAD